MKETIKTLGEIATMSQEELNKTFKESINKRVGIGAFATVCSGLGAATLIIGGALTKFHYYTLDKLIDGSYVTGFLPDKLEMCISYINAAEWVTKIGAATFLISAPIAIYTIYDAYKKVKEFSENPKAYLANKL